MHHYGPARWIVTFLLLLAGGLTPAVGQSGNGPRPPYDMGEAERTFAYAYHAISERALEPVDAGAVAMEGMRGLSSLSPSIGVARSGDRVRLTSYDRLVAEYPAPRSDDSRGWARLTVTIALDARDIAPEMAAANLEQTYQAVFDSTLAKLDVFSRYAGAAEARAHRDNRSGFGGIGIRFDMVDQEARLTEVLPNTPAAKAGLREGDILTHVEGRSLAGLDREDIGNRLRGPIASDVAVTVRRGFKPLDITVRRALIVPPTVTMTVRNGIGEIQLSGFNENTVSSLSQALRDLKQQTGASAKGVILDLRGNPGGLLDQAVAVADLFIAQGTVVSTQGRHPRASQTYDAHEGDNGENLPVVALIDGKSASAAEIVAAALQDDGRAVIVGTNSYGKGTVQTVINLPNDGEVTLTWSRFHAPSGYALHGLGVMPVICTAAGGTVQTARASLNTLHAIPPAVSNLALWRGSRLDETRLRAQLRETCPAETHAERHKNEDLAIARDLLETPDLFGKALALSSLRHAVSAAIFPTPVEPPSRR